MTKKVLNEFAQNLVKLPDVALQPHKVAQMWKFYPIWSHCLKHLSNDESKQIERVEMSQASDWARRPGPKSQVALSKGKARAHPAKFKKSYTKLFSRLESKDKI